MKNILAFDLGNSRAKAKIRGESFSFCLEEGWAEKIGLELKGLESSFALVASVNSKAFRDLKKICDERGVETARFKPIMDKIKLFDYSGVSGIGEDRLAALAGGLKYAAPPIITVEIGTAISITALDADYKCLGGAIFPGPTTQARALADFADALAEVELFFEEETLGNSTEKAIRLGILKSVAAGVEKIIEDAKNSIFRESEVAVFLSGGGAKLIAKYLPRELGYRIADFLALEGVERVAKAYFRTKQEQV